MVRRINRRNFISKSIKTSAVITLGSTLLHLSGCSRFEPRPNIALIKDPHGICELPKGFTYKAFSKYGEIMSDGHTVPDYHDGMGCFEGSNGEIILVRNHEISTYFPINPESPAPEYAYDPDSSGGTTTIWLNDQLEVTKHYLSLTGTIRNCGGGVTPWGTWISSEEAGHEGWVMGKRHGYNFEVDPRGPLKKVEPLKEMGRFNHEAVAIDSESGIVYQTEDNSLGCFYRFIPNVTGRLENGGVLQALKFIDKEITHTTQHPLDLGRKYQCEWVTIDNPDPEENTVHLQAQENGAAIFVRGEGIVAHEDGIYFTCTSGGSQNIGQFFKYIPDSNDANIGGTIELVYEATEKGVMEKPDNITINQWGDLIICEDNGLDQQYILGLTPEGKLYHIAANSQAEWAGACFSPDGKTLFANIQKDPGTTVAIQGPWESLRLS